MSQRDPRQRDNKYLAFIRTLPCCACGRGAPSEAAHIRMANAAIGKRAVGGAEKPHDRYAVPLCGPFRGMVDDVGCHARQHRMREETFWNVIAMKDPFEIAARLYKLGGGEPTTKKPKNRAKIPARKNPWPKGRKIGQ